MIITILIDYKGNFGSKYDAVPYNSGLDQKAIQDVFEKAGYGIEFITYPEVQCTSEFIKDRVFIHDSIEDTGYLYKTYMEDIVYALELRGANILPGYKFIKAHNNKVFMELLRFSSDLKSIQNLPVDHFGTIEEFEKSSSKVNTPKVVKSAGLAMGRGVKLGRSPEEMKSSIKDLSRSKNLYREWWERGRVIKHDNYVPESRHRGKFILQDFVPNLQNDWKILIFSEKVYILKRGVKEGEFKASGSGYNYGFGSKSEAPDGIFDYAMDVFNLFDVPYIAMDVAYNGEEFFLIEFQFVSFGSSTQLKSDCYYTQDEGKWKEVFEKVELEELYASSIIDIINRKKIS